ncbi:hypothetical protein LOAG_07897 [Loa loa]|uniref:Uncharacterized protein n=2 Tax=Loa loa TaxID=7209 RepID=A0A1S0TUT8_LOALO|nr:hypothetical protein LOAG_07897 [Loa loa]EFO20592.2 hypothetical protein LOAG_07897 [Loa loa]
MFTMAYVKSVMNKSSEHMQSLDEKSPHAENVQEVDQTAPDTVKRETEEFNEGIKRTGEALMNNQMLFKVGS